MPYNGVPSDKTAAVEACVEKVMKQGHDKSSAIAICHASIVGTKDTETASPNATYAFGSGGLLNTPGLGGKRGKRKAKVINATLRTKENIFANCLPLTNSTRSRELSIEAVSWVAATALKEIATKAGSSYPWDQCVADQMKRYGSRDTAEKVCGAIRAGKERIEIEAELGLVPISSFTVYKQSDGTYRWCVTSSNAFEDYDREFVSQKSQDEDTDRMNASGDFGPLRWWHLGDLGSGVDIGACDFSVMHGPWRIESGTFKDDSIAHACMVHQKELAVSLGFTHSAMEPDAQGVYHHIHVFERSLLPRYKAANPYTAFAVMKENDEMASLEEKWQEFVALNGGDEAKAKEYVQSLDNTSKELSAKGVKHKEAGAPVSTNGTAATTTVPVTTKAMPAALAAAQDKPGDKPVEAKAVGDPSAAPGDLWGEGSPQEEASEPPAEAAAEGDQGAGGASIADMTVGELQQALAQMLASMILQSTKEISDRIVVLETAQTTRTKELDDSAKRIKDLHRRVKELEGDAPRQPGFRASAQGPAPRQTVKEQQPTQDPLVAHMLEGIQQVMGGQ